MLTGIVFGTLLSSFGYVLLGYSLHNGAFFGFVLGFCIIFFSLLFVSNMNKRILPKVDKKYWLLIAAVFSFLSGFLGTYLGVLAAEFLGIEVIEFFDKNLFLVSIWIGVLSYFVGFLLYSFVRMRNEKDVLDKQYLESRLSSLETQLNPHFLFNSLNSIAELVHQDPSKAEAAILKVSRFLRNSMQESAKLSLQDEIRNLKQYVELENIRFDGKIVVEIESEVPNWSVPKFSLQLLVENAIKHGFEYSMKNLVITISFDIEKKIIMVQNNGKPMKKVNFKIGLTNLNQRLVLMCKGKLVIKSLEKPMFYIYLGECGEDTYSR